MRWPFARSTTVRALDEALEYALGTCTELDEECEALERQRAIESEHLRMEHIARIGTESLLDLARVELEASRLAHSRTRAQAAAGNAHLKGEIKGLKIDHVAKTHYANMLLLDHEWHIGGMEVAHGRIPLIKYECACGAIIYAKEGEL